MKNGKHFYLHYFYYCVLINKGNISKNNLYFSFKETKTFYFKNTQTEIFIICQNTV